MNPRCLRFLLALLILSVAPFARALDATAILTCTSVKVPPAQSGDYLLGFTLDPDLVNDEIQVSGELELLYFTVALLDVSGVGIIPFDLNIGVPDPGDSDPNGISDFFEVHHAVAPAETAGFLLFDDGMEVITGTVNATWQRDAGSTTGTVRMRVNVPDFAMSNVLFDHTFEIFSYRGTYSYSVSGVNVTGAIDVNRQGGEGSYTGPFNLTRIDQDELFWDTANWTGPAGVPFEVLSSIDTDLTLLRGGARTNYFGVFFFADGIPATPFPDEYDLWTIDIFDPNDTDGDGLADLSDTPGGVVPPTPPVLALRVDGGVVKLKITGKQGQQIQLEQSTSLSPLNWTPGQTLTLTADTQEFDLGTPATDQFFIRGKVL